MCCQPDHPADFWRRAYRRRPDRQLCRRHPAVLPGGRPVCSRHFHRPLTLYTIKRLCIKSRGVLQVACLSVYRSSGCSPVEFLLNFPALHRHKRKTPVSVLYANRCFLWLRGLDLNQRPSGYEPDELPDCSTPRYGVCAPLWPFAEAVSLGASL